MTEVHQRRRPKIKKRERERERERGEERRSKRERRVRGSEEKDVQPTGAVVSIYQNLVCKVLGRTEGERKDRGRETEGEIRKVRKRYVTTLLHLHEDAPQQRCGPSIPESRLALQDRFVCVLERIDQHHSGLVDISDDVILR